MICPKCKGKVRVEDTHGTNDMILRKRKCLECGYRFYTKECETTDAHFTFNVLDNEFRNKLRRRERGSI